MSSDLLIDMAWKAALCSGLTLLWLKLDVRRSAAERSVVAHAGLIATLLLPLASAAMPVWTIEAPAEWAGSMWVQAPEAANDQAVLPVLLETHSTSPLRETDWLVAAYAIPAALLLGILFSAIVRLRFLRVRARAPADTRWLSAMADAERKMK